MTEPAALAFEERRFSLPQLDALADGLGRGPDKKWCRRRVNGSPSWRPTGRSSSPHCSAIWRLGATAVLISPAWKRDEVEHALALTDPAHAVGDHPVLAGLMPMLHLDEPIAAGEPRAGSPAAPAPTRCWSSVPAPPACRRPSGTPTRRWMRPSGTGGDALGLTRRDRIQIATPPSHILGLLNILTALRTRRPDAAASVDSTSTRCCTTSKMTASQSKWRSRPSRWPSPRTRRLESYDLSSLRFIMWGATPVSAERRRDRHPADRRWVGARVRHHRTACHRVQSARRGTARHGRAPGARCRGAAGFASDRPAGAVRGRSGRFRPGRRH